MLPVRAHLFWGLSVMSMLLIARALTRPRASGETRDPKQFWTSARAANSGSKRRKKKLERDQHTKFQTPIIACENCNDYRDLIPRCIEHDDIVLEVGCHVGATTGLIAAIAKHTVGIDASDFWLPEARQAYPHVRFEHCDCWDVTRIKSFGLSFSKIFVDISGSRDLKTLFPLIECYIKAFEPQVIIVKSFKLKRMLQQCKLAEEYALQLPHDYDAKLRALEMVASRQKKRRPERMVLAESSMKPTSIGKRKQP